jgi:hypothetical protein
MAASGEVRRLSFTLEMAMAPRLGLEVSPALVAFSELLILPFAAMQSVVEDKLGANAALERLDAGLGDPELPEQLVVVAVHQLQVGLTVEELVHSRVVQLASHSHGEHHPGRPAACSDGPGGQAADGRAAPSRLGPHQPPQIWNLRRWHAGSDTS